jgi:hypothetical protein
LDSGRAVSNLGLDIDYILRVYVVLVSRAVESAHKSSDSDSSIFKTSDSNSDSSIFKTPTPS